MKFVYFLEIIVDKATQCKRRSSTKLKTRKKRRRKTKNAQRPPKNPRMVDREAVEAVAEVARAKVVEARARTGLRLPRLATRRIIGRNKMRPNRTIARVTQNETKTTTGKTRTRGSTSTTISKGLSTQRLPLPRTLRFLPCQPRSRN